MRGLFVPPIRSPEVNVRAKAMGDYLRFKSVLAPRDRERDGDHHHRARVDAELSMNAHQPAALKAGLRPEIAGTPSPMAAAHRDGRG